MSWNYRVIKAVDGDGHVSYGVHEVIYEKTAAEGSVAGWTAREVTLVSDTRDGLCWQMGAMLLAITKPVLIAKGDELEQVESGEEWPAELIGRIRQMMQAREEY